MGDGISTGKLFHVKQFEFSFIRLLKVHGSFEKGLALKT